MILRKIGIALLIVGAILGTWLLGAVMYSLLYFIASGQSTNDSDARVAGVVFLILMLILLGTYQRMKRKQEKLPD